MQTTTKDFVDKRASSGAYLSKRERDRKNGVRGYRPLTNYEEPVVRGRPRQRGRQSVLTSRLVEETIASSSVSGDYERQLKAKNVSITARKKQNTVRKEKTNKTWTHDQLKYVIKKQSKGLSRNQIVELFHDKYGLESHSTASIHRQVCQFQKLDKQYKGQQKIICSKKAIKIAIEFDSNRYQNC